MVLAWRSMSNLYNRQIVNQNKDLSFNLLVAVVFLTVIVPFASVFLFKAKLPFFFYLFLFSIARAIYVVAKVYNSFSLKISRSIDAQEKLGKKLTELPSSWRFETNISLPNLGELDFLVFGPGEKIFAIEVKSHFGEVLMVQEKLKRKINDKIISFEKDFIRQVELETKAVKELRGFKEVTSVLLFSNATLDLKDKVKIRDVYILGLNDLNEFLLNYNSALVAV